MRFVIEKVKCLGGGTYRVEYTNFDGVGTTMEIHAKDELDAFKQVQERLEKGKKTMKVAIICGTLVIVALLTSLTYVCEIKANQRKNEMEMCVKAGKSYVSEAEGYSCRDPFVKVKR